jgi:hypothetical protein
LKNIINTINKKHDFLNYENKDRIYELEKPIKEYIIKTLKDGFNKIIINENDKIFKRIFKKEDLDYRKDKN